MQHEFYSIRVANRTQETADSFTIELEIPDQLRTVFDYRPGQYITLQLEENGSPVQKSFSLSSSPIENKWSLTIKKQENDVSTALFEALHPGVELRASKPQGHFTFPLEEEKERCYFMFAAGSGITPMRSLITTILEVEPKSSIFLLYGNRDPDTTIFREELEGFEKKYSGQLVVEFLYSRIEKGSSFIGSLFRKKSVGLNPGLTKGRIDPDTAANFLRRHDCYGNSKEYFICGPGKMISAMMNFLLAQDINKEHIHLDHSTAHEEHAEAASEREGAATLIAHLFGERIEVSIEDKTVLETLQDAGYDPPFSCQSGACSTCMARIIEGSATMEMCYALDDAEIEDGLVLTCQAHPTTDVLEITYDV